MGLEHCSTLGLDCPGVSSWHLHPTSRRAQKLGDATVGLGGQQQKTEAGPVDHLCLSLVVLFVSQRFFTLDPLALDRGRCGACAHKHAPLGMEHRPTEAGLNSTHPLFLPWSDSWCQSRIAQSSTRWPRAFPMWLFCEAMRCNAMQKTSSVPEKTKKKMVLEQPRDEDEDGAAAAAARHHLPVISGSLGGVEIG